MTYISLFILTVSFFVTLVHSEPPAVCTQCQQSNTCNPPECFCCRDDLKIPNIDVSQIPQMVFFTFDDAVTTQVAGFYHELFDSTRKNPNGCPISMTLFISHDNTDYRLVSDFHQKGMEIASHSVTHSTMNGSNFLQEAKSQKENLAKLANIPIDEITGWRSPFLKPTGDLQPDALKKLGYTYDATLTYSKRSYTERPPGPFTLDFGFPYECQVKPCPTHKHPGFWEVPVVSLMDYKHKYDCVYVDGCMNAPPDEATAYKFLWENFNNYYTTTRMPFGINMHPSWFFYPDRLRAMDKFIQKLATMNDVYIVSANRMLEWLKHPTPLKDLHSFSPWACDGREKKFNSGARVVKTNLPPPPHSMAWLPRVRTNSRVKTNSQVAPVARTVVPKNSFTPAPVIPQLRRVTQNSREGFRTRTLQPQVRSPDSIPVPVINQRREGSSANTDFIRNLELQQQRIRDEIRRRRIQQWQNRRRQNGALVARPDSIVKISQNKVPAQNVKSDTNSQARKVLTQREIMEQHEKRLRQHKLLEERQRNLERQRLKEEAQKKIEQSQGSKRNLTQLQSETKQPQPIKNSQQVDQRTLPKQQHILWRPDLKPDLIRPSETRQARPVTVQQDTIQIWPSVAPKVLPVQRQASRAVQRFNDRRFQTTGNVEEISMLRDRIGRPFPSNFPSATPAPFANIFRYNEPRTHVWYDNFGNRYEHVFNGLRNSRGGSNRRRGFVNPTAVPTRMGPSVQMRPTLQPKHVRTSNETGGMQGLNGMQENKISANSVRPDFFGSQQPVAFSDRTIEQHRNSLPRNSVDPSIAQRMAWTNFIRQMLGPH